MRMRAPSSDRLPFVGGTMLRSIPAKPAACRKVRRIREALIAEAGGSLPASRQLLMNAFTDAALAHLAALDVDKPDLVRVEKLAKAEAKALAAFLSSGR